VASASPIRLGPGWKSPVGARLASAIDDPNTPWTLSCARSDIELACPMFAAGVAARLPMIRVASALSPAIISVS
jgi:hypothetical protein